MSAESKPELQLEIGHVLFIDIVGYSKLLINEQSEALKALNNIVRGTPRFRSAEAAGQLIRLPTGDGMALVFLDTLEAPAQCALEISRELRGVPQFGVRMGVHSGPVNQVADVSGRLNLTGAGINVACRVMDCGDAGHILLSRRVAEDLSQYRQWQPNVHDLGEVKVKHDVTIGLANLYTEELGNPQRPAKLAPEPASGRVFRDKPTLIALLALIVALGAGIGLFLFMKPKGEPPLDQKSIAVLPFENLSDDQANAYFAQGIQDEILTRLAKIGGLKVISRTSTQQYKSAPENLADVGRQLGVAHILEGSVQKSGDSARINVQLIHALSDSHVWAETYDRKLTDILAVETEVAKAIAEQLQVKLTGSEQKALSLKFTDNTEAYDAYLRGLSFEGHQGFSSESLAAKVKAFRMAVDFDPQFAPAWARLSSAHIWTYYQFDRTPQRLAMAKQALDSALLLAPDTGEALIALGHYYYGTQDYEGALDAYRQARERLPNNAEVLLRMGGVTRRLGRWEEALVLHTHATQLDPRNTEVWKHQGFTLRGLRRYAEALTAFDRALQAAPGDADLIGEKATTLQMQGDFAAAAKLLDSLPPDADRGQLTPRRFPQWLYERQYAPALAALKSALEKRENFPKAAIAEALFNLATLEVLAGERAAGLAHATESRNLMEKVRQEGDENPWYAITHVAQTYSLLGDYAAARREAERAVAAYAKDAMVFPQALTVLARVQCEAGEVDAAIATLTRVLKIYCAYAVTPALLRMEPVWDPIRNDPRFQALCQDKS